MRNMTRTLELTPDAAAILERAAANRHMTLDDFLSELAEREAQRLADSGNGLTREAAARSKAKQSLATWLSQREAARPIIEAGTPQPITSGDVTRFIHESRAERESEMDAAAGATDSYGA